MIRWLLRKALIGAAFWLLGPMAVVFGHSVLVPERVGVFEEHAGATFARAGHGPYAYHAPEDVGMPYQFEIGPVAGFGAPEARRWYGFGPTVGAPRPVLVLLHGGGRTGVSMIDMWRDLAGREDIILLAPDARSTQWSLLTDGPMFLAALLKDAAARYPLDMDRIYLAGHSDGGAHAMRIANLGGGPFKAVVTHSGHSPMPRVIPALNPVPIHSFVGDLDVVFTVDSSRAALKHLARAGHPTSLTVIPGHNHWYYGIGKSLAAVMWHRLTKSTPEMSDPAPSPVELVQRPTPEPRNRAAGAKWISVPQGE
ncbi:alpha/beta hydrolase [Marivita sp. S0852]|uniref:alpha/beta hydrolase n=1 Tax=Marivita sp. S0852 TaxID=3373893 RepID=UPI0039821E24